MVHGDHFPIGKSFARCNGHHQSTQIFNCSLYDLGLQGHGKAQTGAIVAHPTRLRPHVIEKRAQEQHAAVLGPDVFRHLILLRPALAGHSHHSVMIEAPASQRSPPTRTVTLHSPVNLQVLEEVHQLAPTDICRPGQLVQGQRLHPFFQPLHDPLSKVGRRERRVDKVILDIAVFASSHQYSPGAVQGPPCSAHLLVIGNR